MKPIPDRFKPMLAELRQLRRELKELRENPQPRPDMLEAFRAVFRDGAEDESARESTERPSV
jgi:hypothetical protein